MRVRGKLHEANNKPVNNQLLQQFIYSILFFQRPHIQVYKSRRKCNGNGLLTLALASLVLEMSRIVFLTNEISALALTDQLLDRK